MSGDSAGPCEHLINDECKWSPNQRDGKGRSSNARFSADLGFVLPFTTGLHLDGH